jgi:putative membrane protein
MLINHKLPLRYLFNMIRQDIVRVFFFSILFNVFKYFFSDILPSLPAQLPTILGTSISLILAFKLNQSYERWWEARRIWGAIVNDSRTLVLELKGFIQVENLKPNEAGSLIKKMAYRQIGWCYALGESLRDLDPTETINRYLTPEEAGYVLAQRNKPYAMLALHMQDLKNLQHQQALNAYQQVQLDATLSRLTDAMGASERINSTVFPVTYRMFVHLFIYLFLIVLSLSLVETLGPLEIPLLIIIASTLFLLEKTATYLQDPFVNMPTDTPVTAIARNIEINIRQILQDPDVPEPLEPEGFYLM